MRSFTINCQNMAQAGATDGVLAYLTRQHRRGLGYGQAIEIGPIGVTVVDPGRSVGKFTFRRAYESPADRWTRLERERLAR